MVETAYLKLLLIRHAQSLGNLQGRMEGQSSTELSALGISQAQQLSARLMQSSELPSHLYSSPLLRASQTTQYLTDALKQMRHPYEIRQTIALQEMHQGIFQGLTWAQAQATYPDLCAQLVSSLAWQPVPQAESPPAARSRAQQWMQCLLKQHQCGDVIWAVSHEGFLQQLISVVLGCDRTWKISIAPTAIFEFWLASTHPLGLGSMLGVSSNRFDPDRFNPEHWILRRFNDCSHLADAEARESGSPSQSGERA
jgi:broad specificity phosphatase PhoE